VSTLGRSRKAIAQPGGPPQRGPRSAIERGLGRLVATAGIIGIGAGLGALLASNKVQGWITGLVIAVVSIVLVTLLRRS
jgi:tetrahydromethanopterin S-methyltransferase subunit F